YPSVAKGIEKVITLDAWLLPVAFILTIVCARLLIGLIARQVMRLVPEDTRHDRTNKYLGIIPGIVNGLICATIVAALLLTLPLKRSITVETQRSQIAKTLSAQAKWANKKLAPVFDQAVRQTMGSLTASSGHDEVEQLSFTCDDPETEPLLEA